MAEYENFENFYNYEPKNLKKTSKTSCHFMKYLFFINISVGYLERCNKLFNGFTFGMRLWGGGGGSQCITTVLPNAFLMSSTDLLSHRENMSVKCIPPKTPLLYNENGVYRGKLFFLLFLLQNIDCGYTLEPPQ